jgi:transcriptional regulator with XRE-family HTH domain
MAKVIELKKNAPVNEETWGTLNGAILAAWRKNMGYSKREAVRQLGCSRQAWDDWENDNHKIPRYIVLAIDALALGSKGYAI